MPGPDYNWLMSSQQALRNMGIERAKKTNPDKRHDKKFLIIAIVAIVLVCAGMMTVPYWGDVLLWLLD